MCARTENLRFRRNCGGSCTIMKLNLGSGERPLINYVNIDAIKHTDETVIGDILNLNYPDNSIDAIFSEHVIEHLDKPELDRFFSECQRLLKEGGKLELIAPDFIKVIHKYINKEKFGIYNSQLVDIEFLDSLLYGPQRHPYDYHKQSIYKEKLETLCSKHKFKIVKIYYQDRIHSENEICLSAIKRI